MSNKVTFVLVSKTRLIGNAHGYDLLVIKRSAQLRFTISLSTLANHITVCSHEISIGEIK